MLDLTLKLIQLAPWVISGASLICALTPTPKDDQMLAKVYWFCLLYTSDAADE